MLSAKFGDLAIFILQARKLKLDTKTQLINTNFCEKLNLIAFRSLLYFNNPTLRAFISLQGLKDTLQDRCGCNPNQRST